MLLAPYGALVLEEDEEEELCDESFLVVIIYLAIPGYPLARQSDGWEMT